MFKIEGPCTQGYGVCTEILGKYVTIVCGDPDVSQAIAEMLGNGFITPMCNMMCGTWVPPVLQNHEKLPGFAISTPSWAPDRRPTSVPEPEQKPTGETTRRAPVTVARRATKGLFD